MVKACKKLAVPLWERPRASKLGSGFGLRPVFRNLSLFVLLTWVYAPGRLTVFITLLIWTIGISPSAVGAPAGPARQSAAEGSTGKVQSFYLLLERGNALYQAGEYAKAILLYRKSYERGADPSIVFFNMGNCYYRMERLPQAAAAFKRSIRENPRPPALFNLANVLFRLEHYGEAIATYRRGLRTEPENLSAWIYLSDAYARTGDWVGSQQALEKALALDSSEISVLYQLAEVHLQLGEVERAVQLIKAAFEKNPSEVDFLFYVGDLYRSQQRYQDAAEAYRQGLFLDPDNGEVMYKLADVFYQLDKFYLCMDYLQRILQINPTSDAAIFLGNVAYELKWWDRSRDAYLKALKQGNREGVEGYRNLAYESFTRGQIDRAILLLEEALQWAPDHIGLRQDLDQYRRPDS